MPCDKHQVSLRRSEIAGIVGLAVDRVTGGASVDWSFEPRPLATWYDGSYTVKMSVERYFAFWARVEVAIFYHEAVAVDGRRMLRDGIRVVACSTLLAGRQAAKLLSLVEGKRAVRAATLAAIVSGRKVNDGADTDDSE